MLLFEIFKNVFFYNCRNFKVGKLKILLWWCGFSPIYSFILANVRQWWPSAVA